ncbi:50S ribosomal protein L21e [Candidatus Pacearchaeota archaeon]|nr:50S ribosomal protein L21e [Candidatus Pacearchaeota archaeon]
MANRKQIRARGNVPFSRYFQKLEQGEKVAFARERAMPSDVPGRFQGRTGEIEGKRGRFYIVKIKDSDKEKRFIIDPVHLIKIKQIQK